MSCFIFMITMNHVYVMVLFLALTDGDLDDSFELLWDSARRQGKDQNNLNQSFFPSLENYQVNAQSVTEDDYTWIARVVHSRTGDLPHVCTAVCIDEGIFITAARCIYGLIVRYTTVIYRQGRFPVVAFVLPSNTTKQLHDDIGFIVVDDSNFQEIWPVIELFGKSNRTDNTFKWFASLESTFTNVKVVGYATKKGDHKITSAHRKYDLTELSVVVGMGICSKILKIYGHKEGFHVPCYHSCKVQDFFSSKKINICKNYHGVEGGAVFDKQQNILIGIATWGTYFPKYELPVGFSVVNSLNFFMDYSCARRIRDVGNKSVKAGYYQSLCDLLQLD